MRRTALRERFEIKTCFQAKQFHIFALQPLDFLIRLYSLWFKPVSVPAHLRADPMVGETDSQIMVWLSLTCEVMFINHIYTLFDSVCLENPRLDWMFHARVLHPSSLEHVALFVRRDSSQDTQMVEKWWFGSIFQVSEGEVRNRRFHIWADLSFIINLVQKL